MQNAPTNDRAPLSWLPRIAMAGLLFALVAIAYHAAPDNGFHFDDAINIVRRGPVHMVTFSADALYRAATEGLIPTRLIPNLSFALDWWRGGGAPGPFQATNVVIHAVTALAVLALLQRVLRRTGAPPADAWLFATAATALWAVHPIQVQAVTYIVQRMASLATLFMLVAVYAFVKGRTGGRPLRWFALAAAASLAGCLSKENAFILPLLFLLAEYALCRDAGERIRSPIDRLLIALPALAAAWVALDLALLQGPLWSFVTPGYETRDFTLAERLLTQPRVVFFHLGQILLPLPGRFSIEHDLDVSHGLLSPWTTALALAGMLTWIAGGIWLVLRSRHAHAGFFVLWIPITLAIESSIIPLEMVFEHRMYLPSVGLAGLFALGALKLARSGHRRISLAAATVLAALFLSATLIRVPAWKSSVTLYEHAARTAPGRPRVWTNLATAYEGEDRTLEAIAAYTRALELDPAHALAYLNRGSSHRKTGNPVAAERDYRRFMELRPADFRGPYALGALMSEGGQIAAAEGWLRRAAQLHTGTPLPHRELARVFLRTGRPADAITALDAARQRDPAVADADFHDALGIASGRLGRYGDAIAAFRRALQLQPGRGATRVNLGYAYLRNGNARDALVAFDAALSADPMTARAHSGRAESLLQLGYRRDAVAAARRALQLDPADGRARELIGEAVNRPGG